MSNLLMRRPLLLQSGGASEWDSEWYYTDGRPDIAGWTLTSGTVGDVANGLRIANGFYDKSVDITHGVIEAKLIVDSYRTGMNTRRAMLRIGNESKAVALVFNRYNDNYITLYDNSNIANGTRIGNFTFDGEYVVRLTIDGDIGKVEVNDVVLTDSVDTSSMYNKGLLRFGNNESYGRATWQYVRYKAG